MKYPSNVAVKKCMAEPRANQGHAMILHTCTLQLLGHLPVSEIWLRQEVKDHYSKVKGPSKVGMWYCKPTLSTNVSAKYEFGYLHFPKVFPVDHLPIYLDWMKEFPQVDGTERGFHRRILQCDQFHICFFSPIFMAMLLRNKISECQQFERIMALSIIDSEVILRYVI